MHPKSPANSRLGGYTARVSCREGPLFPSGPLESCAARKSCHPLMDLALAQGCAPQRLANTRHLPMPATCQYLSPAVPIAARDKPPMDFGGGHAAHGLQFGQAPRDRRLHRLDGQADNGMLRRAGPELQNREQVGAEPPAEAAGPAGPAAALPKTPIERTDPSWRNYRNTSSSRMAMAFAYFSARRWSFSVMRGSLDRSLL